MVIDQGMFGTEEEHVITVQDKEREFFWDSGCWAYFFTDESDNIYNTNSEIYAKI
jgi:hypothetical protein